MATAVSAPRHLQAGPHRGGVTGQIQHGAVFVDRLLQLAVTLGGLGPGHRHQHPHLGKPGTNGVVEPEEAPDVQIALGVRTDVIAVAETGHVPHAADELNISQSGLSASVRALERDLATPLFERTTRPVVLTAAGGTLLGHARRILREVEATEAAIAAPHKAALSMSDQRSDIRILTVIGERL